MQVLVIPDVHLKDWMFREADAILDHCEEETGCVILGDLADDWGCETQLDRYEAVYREADAFMEKHEQTLFCYGNHDVAYVWRQMQSGYSFFAEPIVDRCVWKLGQRWGARADFVHRIGNTLFSHAGITRAFAQRICGDAQDTQALMHAVNNAKGNDLWRADSPIWTRVQYSSEQMAPAGMIQVVGHTPVPKPLWDAKRKVLTLDTFSTMPNGRPIGDCRMVFVDSETGEWTYAQEARHVG